GLGVAGLEPRAGPTEHLRGPLAAIGEQCSCLPGEVRGEVAAVEALRGLNVVERGSRSLVGARRGQLPLEGLAGPPGGERIHRVPPAQRPPVRLDFGAEEIHALYAGDLRRAPEGLSANGGSALAVPALFERPGVLIKL